MEKESSVLAIDSSTSKLSVGLSRGTETFLDDSTPPLSHDEGIAQAVERILHRAAIKTPDVVVVGKGPGSFTGLRIGYSFAQGFVFGSSIRMYFASSLRAAASAVQRSKNVLVLADARRDDFFCGQFTSTAEAEKPEEIVSRDEAVALIHRSPSVVALDSASFALASGHSNTVTGLNDLSLAHGLLQLYSEGQLTENCEPLESIQPNYLRRVAAKTIAERAAPSTT